MTIFIIKNIIDKCYFMTLENWSETLKTIFRVSITKYLLIYNLKEYIFLLAIVKLLFTYSKDKHSASFDVSVLKNENVQYSN